MLEYPLASGWRIFRSAMLALILFIAVFELRYPVQRMGGNQKGNLAAAMATGGKIFGICNICSASP